MAETNREYRNDVVLALGSLFWGWSGSGRPIFRAPRSPLRLRRVMPAVEAVRTYAEAVAGRDSTRVAQNDFVCLLKMVEAGVTGQGAIFA